ncbi:MAG TPA: hypothetical protein VIL37_06900 [Natronosporangium sp.]
MSREPVIDLGLLDPVPVAAKVEAGPVPAATPVRWSARRRRSGSAWLIAVLVLSLVGGSGAPPVLPVSVPVPVDGRFEVVGELLFVAVAQHRAHGHPGPARGSSSSDWVAYDLSTGEQLWTMSGLGERLDLVAADGLLWDGGFPLDPATGQWLSPKRGSVPGGHRYLGVPGVPTVVVSGGYRPYNDAAVDLEFTYEVMGVDTATGAVRWRDEPDPGVRVWLAGDPVRLLTISSDERVAVRDPDTGAVLASRRIPNATSAHLIGDRLLVRVWEAGGEIVRAFTRETMTPVWELSEPVGRLEQCGQMLCVQIGSNLTRAVMDPVTGDRWPMPLRTELIDPADGEPAWATAYRLYPVADRFLGYGDDGALRALLDAGSGRVLRDLTGWQAVVPPIRRGLAAGPVTLLRPGPDGDSQVASLDLTTGRLTELGAVPGRPDRCQPYPGGVVCRQAGRVWVWPL